MKHIQSARVSLTAFAAFALLLLLTAAPLLAVAQGRLISWVYDEDGNPLPDVEVTLRALDVSFEDTDISNKKGKFSFLVVDATHDFVIRLYKEGYMPIEEPLRFQLQGTLRKEWTMVKSALAEAAEMLKGTPEAVILFNEAAEAFNNGDAATAIDKFKQVIALAPDMKEPYSALARAYLSQGDYESSITFAQQWQEKSPEDPAPAAFLYDTYLDMGDQAKADEALDQLIAADPSPETAKRVFNRGVDAINSEDRSGAIGFFERALGIDPLLDQAYSALANIYLSKGEYEKALLNAEKLLEVDPGNLEAITVGYECHRALGNEDKAAEAFAALQSIDPDKAVEAFYRQGVALFNGGNIEDATEAFERARATDASHARSHYMLGLCYLNSGNMVKAKEFLQAFVDMAPEDPEAALAKDMLASLQ